jgi:hypothetical protein
MRRGPLMDGPLLAVNATMSCLVSYCHTRPGLPLNRSPSSYNPFSTPPPTRRASRAGVLREGQFSPLPTLSAVLEDTYVRQVCQVRLHHQAFHHLRARAFRFCLDTVESAVEQWSTMPPVLTRASTTRPLLSSYVTSHASISALCWLCCAQFPAGAVLSRPPLLQ